MEKMSRNNREVDCEKSQNNKGLMKYGLMMMLCCFIPILIIAGLPLFGIKGGFLSSLVFLLCPLMHIGMIFMLRKNGHSGSCHGTDKSKNIEVENKE